MNIKYFICLFALILVACGEQKTIESVTEVWNSDMVVAETVEKLPECGAENEGSMAWIKKDKSTRTCSAGKWVATEDSFKDTLHNCSMAELPAKNGYKIVCDGDSVGFISKGINGTNGENGRKGQKGSDGENGKNGTDGVQGDKGENGTDGENGANGSDCSIVNQSDSLVTIVCGENELTLYLNQVGGELPLDSEVVPISLDSLVGYTQKGPFLKGSVVYLYELSDGRTLKQTNGNFTSNITQDDGRYKFTSRNLVSQYALLVVDGYYRNEVTGEPSNAPIKLRAITNMLSRRSANVNLLTHLEYDRVYRLVTRDKMTVRAAKSKAQAELMKLFHIDTTGLKTQSEDMDVFGKTDADAALLAVSVLLQGERSESDMMVLLTEISNAFELEGTWDDSKMKREMADWAINADLSGGLSKIRANVKSWGYASVPNFEKFIRNYWMKELKVGKCTASLEGDTLEIAGTDVSVQSLRCDKGEWKINRMRDLRDGNVYRTVYIGDQLWFAENLNYGDTLANPGLRGWNSRCYDDADSCARFGRLYSWSAAVDSVGMYGTNAKGCGAYVTCSPVYPIRGVCPERWHLPDSMEWKILYEFMGSNPEAMMAKDYDELWSGTDDYGFTAVPAGCSYTGTPSTPGSFCDRSDEFRWAWFWTSSMYDYFGASTVQIAARFREATQSVENRYEMMVNGKDRGYSVRCIHD